MFGIVDPTWTGFGHLVEHVAPCRFISLLRRGIGSFNDRRKRETGGRRQTDRDPGVVVRPEFRISCVSQIRFELGQRVL